MTAGSWLIAPLLLSLFLPSVQRNVAPKHSLQTKPTDSMERKLEQVRKNGASTHPEPTVTAFTEEEINAYFTAGKVPMPRGVESVRFEGLPGELTANARVDFDQIKSGHNSLNPLLTVFAGVHDIVVAAHAHGADRKGFVRIDSVSLDGVEIPRFLLQLVAEKYLQPKYPGIGLDSQFPLPDHVDSAVIGEHALTVQQK